MTKNEYKYRICSIFAEGYPFSAQYRGGRRMRKGNWDQVFPGTETDVEEKTSFIEAAEELEAGGIVSISWGKFRRGDKITAIFLDNPDLLYRELGQEDPEALARKTTEALASMKVQTRTGEKIRDYVLSLLENRSSLPVNTDRELFDILKLAGVTKDHAEAHTIRNLSIRLFNDSKRIESILKNADRLSEAACGIKLSESLGLKRSYPQTLFRGKCTLRFKKRGKWDTGDMVVGLPLSTVRNIKAITWKKKNPHLLVIENKETFYVWSEHSTDFDGYLYTGGYPNTADTTLLQLLAGCGCTLSYFGDLDPEGLLIFQTIARAIPPVRPYRMNEHTYTRFFSLGYDLEESALSKLSLVTFPGFRQLVHHISLHKKGVEQEIIPVHY